MNENNYQSDLRDLWERAVSQYEQGNHDPETYYNERELKILTDVGVKPGEMFDYAEDYVEAGEPDFATFAMIHELRKNYLHDVQHGQPSDRVMDPSEFPERDAQALGISWLPRIVEKARGKLRGELPPDLMYSCSGDRRFLKEHDIHPAEFLRQVRDSEDDRDALLRWFAARSKAARN